MKPHPRHPFVRKAVKWGGAVVVVLLVVAWVGSGRFHLLWVPRPGLGVIVHGGAFLVLVPNESTPADRWTGWEFEPHPASMRWWFDTDRSGTGDVVYVPIWVVVVGVVVPTVVAWRRDAWARRVARVGLCAKCGYDRAGLAGDAKCPECGAMPTRA